jgi:hypothetical protein
MSEKEEEIQVREEQDGSVTAELPEALTILRTTKMTRKTSKKPR